MIGTSQDYRERIRRAGGSVRLTAKGTIRFSDDSQIRFGARQLSRDGVSVTESTSSNGTFDIGAAIISSCRLTLKDFDGEFSPYDYTDAVVTLQIGLESRNEEFVEWLQKGVYIVNESKYDDGSIILDCYDNMYYFDRPYGDSKLVYPASLSTIVRDACSVCGVSLRSGDFPNASYVVAARPDDEAVTFRDVISWAAQIAGCWAKCDNNGRLCFGWYDTSELAALRVLATMDDERVLTTDNEQIAVLVPAERSDYLDGGIDPSVHRITGISTQDIALDDVVITGISVTEDFAGADDLAPQRFLYGNKGYVISVEENKLIQEGAAEAVAKWIGDGVIGMRFRPMELSCLSDPSIEAGDRAYVIDRKKNIYATYITSTTFRLGNYQEVLCSAETPARNSAERFSASTKLLVEARKEAKRQISAYDLAVRDMTSLMANSLGMHQTVEIADGGGEIIYQHDKPSLAESSKIWKKSENGFAVSSDGGKTWNSGWDVYGSAVLNMLSVIGLHAEWISTGQLIAKDSEGNIMFLVDIDTGQVIINAQSVSIAGKSVAAIAKEQAEGAVDAQTQADIFNKLTNDGAAKGMFIRNEQLYFSFSYAEGGTLVLGGANNGNGKLSIKNAAGTQIGYIDNTGVHFNEGSFTGAVNATTLSSANAFITGGEIKMNTESYNNAFEVKMTTPQSNGGVLYTKSGMSGYRVSSYKNNTSDGLGLLYTFVEGGGISIGKSQGTIDAPTYHSGLFSVRVAETEKANAFILGEVQVSGDFYVTGTKSRIVETRNFGKVIQHAYEMPSPMFGDIGTGKIGGDGLCYVYFDPVFEETISTDCTYQVFLQKEGSGDLWVQEKAEGYFVVKGTPGLLFSWEAKARQRDYEYERMEVFDDSAKEPESDYAALADAYIKEFEKEIYEYEETY